MKESFFTLFSLSKIMQLLILMNYLILHSNTLAAFTWSPISFPYNFSMASNFLFSMAVRVMFLNLKTVHVILLKMLHQFHIALGIKILSSIMFSSQVPEQIFHFHPHFLKYLCLAHTIFYSSLCLNLDISRINKSSLIPKPE